MRQEVGWEALSLVGHVSLDLALAFDRSEPDRAGPVAERVVDEVAQSLLEAEAVCDEREVARIVDLDAPTRGFCPGFEAVYDVGEELRDLQGGGANRERAPVRAGNREEVLRELSEPVHLLHGRVKGVLELLRAARLADSELELSF
jgi:hypothetical protein